MIWMFSKVGLQILPELIYRKRIIELFSKTSQEQKHKITLMLIALEKLIISGKSFVDNIQVKVMPVDGNIFRQIFFEVSLQRPDLNTGNEWACPWHAEKMYLKHVGMLTVDTTQFKENSVLEELSHQNPGFPRSETD
ncbi:MAG: hypothetical protein ACJ76H_11690 [Bacteriovoracaceae bacterium]